MTKSSDEFRNLNLDKLTKRELKTAEEISKHTVEGYLESRSVDRALHLLTVGDELQKLSVMKNLPVLMKEDLNACIQRIIPRMHQTLPHGTTEYNLGACEAIRTVAYQNLMSPESFTKVFLQHILVSLESRDTVAADEWLQVLLDVIQVLPVNVLQTEVLPIAINKAHISKPIPIRITSCRILGKLALSMTPFLVKKDIIPIVISLCQDVSGEVRAVMSEELPSVANTLGQETSNLLLHHVLDLVSDEESNVRQAAIEALAQMLPKFPADVLKNTIIPLTKKVFSEIMKNEDRLLLVLSKFYGQYAIGLKSVMTPVEKGGFLHRYIQMSQLNANTKQKLNPYKPIVVDEDELALRFIQCRLNCAYNYPAMVAFSTDVKQDLIDSLYNVLKSLASDNYCQVRRKIAAGFYEVTKLMPKWHQGLKTEFIRLLKDEVDVVLEGLVPNISNILISFSNSLTHTADKPDSGKDIGQALFICEKNLSEAPRWRLHEELLLAFRAVPKVFHPEFVYVYFVPLLMSRAVSGRILPCRVAALHTLLVIIIDPSQAKQKLKIRNKILELCNNASFHCRLLFLRGMGILINLHPETVKELFFHNITSMAEDKVPNIRLMVCKLLPKLKNLASDPLDRKLMASVDAAVVVLSGETDRDVLACLKAAMLQMDDYERTKTFKRPGIANGPDVESVRVAPRHVSPTSENPSRSPTPDPTRDRSQALSSYTVANQPQRQLASSASSASLGRNPTADSRNPRTVNRPPDNVNRQTPRSSTVHSSTTSPSISSTASSSALDKKKPPTINK